MEKIILQFIKSMGCLLFIFLSRISLPVEVYFSPGQDCENKIITAIDGSKQEVVVAVYAINNARVVNALKAAHVRGVKNQNSDR
ncbi:MAG: hypothetical protein HY072_10580 [Deltaproteobacteria bacterium]|nr:hypothetical protein [Deltaproteobacteria bacterium]